MIRLLVGLERLLMLPSALLAGLAAFGYTGDFFFSLCPPERLEYLESGSYAEDYTCVAPWYPLAEAFTFIVGAAVAFALFVLLPSLLEPTERVLVAVMAYSAGVSLTFPLFFLGLFSTPELLVAVSLLAVGLSCVFLVERRC